VYAFRRLNLRLRLVFLVLLAVLPGVVLTFYTGEQGRRYARIEAFEQARRLALLFSSNGRAIMEGGRRVLMAMAQSPSLASMDGSCRNYFQNITKENPEFADIIAADFDGRVFCSAAREVQNASVSDQEWFRRAVTRKAFTIGEPLATRPSGRKGMVLAYPMYNGAGQTTITAVYLDMDWLTKLTDSLPLPPGTTVSVVDRRGTFLTRYPETGDWADKSIPQAANILTSLLEKGEDAVETVGIDDIPRLYAFAPLISEPGNEFFVRIGIPAAAAYAESEKFMIRNLVMLGLVAALIILATHSLGNTFILKPVNVLLRATRRLASGDMSFRTGVRAGQSELSQLASSFDNMADNLERSLKNITEAEAKYRGLFENAVEGIFRTTPDGRFQDANPAMARMFGYGSSRELIGSVGDLATDVYVNPGDRKAVLDRLLLSGVVHDCAVEMRRRDGSTMWISIDAQCLRDESGKIVAYEGFAVDISERKRLEKKLIRAKEEAEEANRAKTDFLARMSHGIRTPMTSIIGLTQIVLQTRLREEQRDYLDTVLETAESLHTLMNDMLDLSKLEARALEIESTDFCLHRVIGATLNTLRVQIRGKDLNLDLHMDEAVPRYGKGDPWRLRQVIMNLVGNAIRFTDRGHIRLRVGILPAQMRHRLRRHDGAPLLFAVEDTGPGITPEKLHSIFDVFPKARGAFRDPLAGPNLGLPICRELVGMMGGEIWAEGRPGLGSTFFFTICLPPGDPARAIPLSRVLAPSRETSEPLRILVVEDNKENSRLATAYLSKSGYFAIAAANGQEALDTLRSGVFDVVFMDLEMPAMDGLEATKAIRQGLAGGYNRDIPVVALTAHVLPENREACFQAGMSDFLSKPVDFDEVIDLLSKLVPRRSPPAPDDEGAAPVRRSQAGTDQAESRRPRVLVIDDVGMHRGILGHMLQEAGFEPVAASGAQEGLRMLAQGADLLLVDASMRDKAGFDLTARVRAMPEHAGLPIIMTTNPSDPDERVRAFMAGVDDCLLKPVNPLELRVRAASLLKMRDALSKARFTQANLEVLVRKRTEDLDKALENLTDLHQYATEANRETILCLSAAAEYKDEETAKHLKRMSEYCGLLASRIGLPSRDVELIRLASPMHDVGKIGIPDSILLKPGKLDPGEWEIMRKHPLFGAKILESSTSPVLQSARVIALSHHERWDGRGYPYAVKGKDIPLFGRICAVADVFDALTSNRPYKKAFSAQEAFRIMAHEEDGHFDREILQALLDNKEEFVEIMLRLSDGPALRQPQGPSGG
jgi:PAS domain S-box-containing protein